MKRIVRRGLGSRLLGFGGSGCGAPASAAGARVPRPPAARVAGRRIPAAAEAAFASAAAAQDRAGTRRGRAPARDRTGNRPDRNQASAGWIGGASAARRCGFGFDRDDLRAAASAVGRAGSAVAAGSAGAGAHPVGLGIRGSICGLAISDVKMTAVPSPAAGRGGFPSARSSRASVVSCARFAGIDRGRSLATGFIGYGQAVASASTAKVRQRRRLARPPRCRYRARAPAAESMRSTPPPSRSASRRSGLCRRRSRSAGAGVRDGGLRRGVDRAEPQHDAGDGRHLIGFRSACFRRTARRRRSRSSHRRGARIHRASRRRSPNRPRPWPWRWPAPSRRAPPAGSPARRARRGPRPRSGRAPRE